MKNFKKLIIIFSIIIVSLYSLFFIGVYAFSDLNKYIPQIQTLVKDSLGLNVEILSAKIKPTFKAEIELKINDLKLKYPSSEEMFSLETFSVKVPILHLIIGNIKLSEIKIDKPKANIRPDYFTEYFEKEGKKQTSQETEFKMPKFIRFSTKMPDIKISQYYITIFDKTINDNIYINGEKLNLAKFDISKGVNFSTKGSIGTTKQKFVNYDITLDTFLPKFEQTEKKEETTKTFINPIKSMIDYKFYTDIFADLKITENKTDGINIKGVFDVNNLDLKYNSTNTKGTYAKFKFNKNDIEAISKLYITPEQKADIKSHIKYGKKNNINVAVKSDKLELFHFVQIAQALMDTLGIENDLNQIKVQGYLSPNFSIESDFKAIKSDGHIYLKEGNISHKAFPAKITNITSNINLANNKISIEDTQALVNGQAINIVGEITQQAECDIKIDSKNLFISSLFELFADKNLKNSYKINSGALDINVIIKGKLDKIMPKADIQIKNLNIKDKINNFIAVLPSTNIDIDTDLKTFNGKLLINDSQLKFTDLNITTFLKNLNLNFNDKDIIINPFDIIIQNSTLKTQGKIQDYTNKMEIAIATKGEIATQTIKSLFPKEIQSIIINKGSIPIIADISGDISSINIKGDIKANSNNYITPIEISELINNPSNIKIDIKTKGKDLSINEITFNSNTKQFAKIKGDINSYLEKSPKIKDLRIEIPNNLSFSIPKMKNSLISLKTELAINGLINNPAILGNISINDILIPDLKIKAKDLIINMNNSTIKGSCNKFNLDNSDIKFNMSADNKFETGNFVINDIEVESNRLDLIGILEIFANMPQNSNAPGTDFPIIIKNGRGKINNFSMDAIKAQNAGANFSLKDNTIYLKDLKAKAYNGEINGDLSYNLQYLRLKAKINGKDLDANSAVTAFTGLKDQMNGNLQFKADITMSGATEKEQMQTLRGDANFAIKDGQMGSLGQFEYFLNAQNLLSQKFIKTSIGSVVSKLAPKNTGKFSEMKGDLKFANGWVEITNIISSGANMSLYIFGKYNLLTNYADIDVLGTISQEIVNTLGPIGELSLEKITSSIPKFGLTISKIISGYNMATSEDNLNKIPKLTINDSAAKSFKVKIDGVIDSINAVKSFMWLLNESAVEDNKNRLEANSTIINNVKDLKENIAETINPIKNQSNSNITKEEVKEQIKQTGAELLKEQINKNLPNFLNNIGSQKE